MKGNAFIKNAIDVAPPSAPSRLVLFLTRGMSLREWDRLGILDREAALYKRLAELGVMVDFITYGGISDLRFADRLPGIGIHCNRWNLRQSHYEFLLPVLHWRPLKNCMVIKTNQMDGADTALRAAKAWRKPLLARCGFLLSEFVERQHGQKSALAKWASGLEKKVFSAAKGIAVTTPSMAKSIAGRFPSAAKQTYVIPNYVDTDKFSPEEKGERDIDILFVGRIEPQKNLESLLTAVSGIKAKVVIIGQGSQRRPLMERFMALGDAVSWLDPAPHQQLPSYFNRARLYVQPSFYEGHPKTILEAMACGLPVIGADQPGISDLIRHGENGWLCKNDPESIRAAITHLLERPDLAKKLGRNARSYVLEHCSLDRIMEMEMSVLLQVAMKEHKGTGQLKKILLWPWRLVLRLLPLRLVMALVLDAIAIRAASLPAAGALKFFFNIDQRLYILQGRTAIAYGGGVHVKHRLTSYHDFFVSRIKKDELVLDLGCGDGCLTHAVASGAGAKLVAMDMDAKNIEQAKQRFSHPNIVYLTGDALAEAPKERFDLVILSNILEHLPDRPRFLASLIKQTGASRFLIRVPVFERDWRVALKRELGVEWRLDATHETEYTAESFAAEMKEAGLQIIYQEFRWGEIWAEAKPKP